ncbi:unnamed protein product [Aphanomyces euteiches]
MNRISQLSFNGVLEAAAMPRGSAEQQIISLADSQEVLAHHIVKLDEKWDVLQDRLLQMEHELAYYRSKYGPAFLSQPGSKSSHCVMAADETQRRSELEIGDDGSQLNHLTHEQRGVD